MRHAQYDIKYKFLSQVHAFAQSFFQGLFQEERNTKKIYFPSFSLSLSPFCFFENVCTGFATMFSFSHNLFATFLSIMFVVLFVRLECHIVKATILQLYAHTRARCSSS